MRSYKHILFLLFALWLSACHVLSQPLCRVRNFTSADGLSAMSLSAIEQSGDQLIWLGTWNGLCCYDGYGFTSFSSNPGSKHFLSSRRMAMLAPNSRNDVWCITYDRSLYLFDIHTCRFHDVQSRLPHARKPLKVRKVFALANGTTWVIGDDGAPSYCLSDSRMAADASNEAPSGVLAVCRLRDINKVVLDASGQVWMLTAHGLWAYGKGRLSDKPYAYSAVVRGVPVFASTDGCVAIASAARKGQAAIVRLGDGIEVRGLCAVGQHHVALATNRGVALIDVARPHAKALWRVQGKSVSDVYADRQGSVWAFDASGGVWRIDQSAHAEWLQGSASDASEATVSDHPLFVEDPSGTVWVIAKGGTFSYYDASRHALVPYALRMYGSFGDIVPQVSRYFVDRQGNMWFSAVHGLYCATFSRSDITFISLAKNDDTRALTPDGKGNVWIGTGEGRLALATLSGRVIGYMDSSGRLQHTPQVFAPRVYALMTDRRGRLWIGTKGGGLYVREADGRLRHYVRRKEKGGLPDDNIYDFDVDGQGRIWVATYGGGPVLVDEGQQSLRFRRADELFSNYSMRLFAKVRRVSHTAGGTLIFATNNGLVTAHCAGAMPWRCFVSQREASGRGLMTDDVLQGVPLRSGRLCVVTMGGGLQLSANADLLRQQLPLTSQKGLDDAGGMIFSAVEDDRGRLWVVRENSLDVLSAKGRSVGSYDLNGWVENASYTEAKPFFDVKSHTVGLAVTGGVVIISPQKLRKGTFCPPIVFTGARFQGDNVMRPLLNAAELSVPKDRRNLTIYFSALDYRGNDGISYAYKIEGKDSAWTYVGTSHCASFRNLPPGKLRLLVRSTNQEGVWMDNTRALILLSEPTFWETPWAKVLYVLLLAGAVALGIYIYTLRAKIRQTMEKLSELLRVLRTKSTFMLTHPHTENRDERFMALLKDYLEEHLSDPDMKAEDMAVAVHMSESVFRKRIHDITGMTPGSFVRAKRMERAMYLLAHSDEGVNQVAYLTGFSDPKYFSRTFKKETGMTPSQYRAANASPASDSV